MIDINCLYDEEKAKLNRLNNPKTRTTMSDFKRRNEIHRLKGYCEALRDVKNKKVYTQERDILEKIYDMVSDDVKEIIRECW